MGQRVDAEVAGLGELPDDVGLPVADRPLPTFSDYVQWVEQSAGPMRTRPDNPNCGGPNSSEFPREDDS
jgi:hypothetical protein